MTIETKFNIGDKVVIRGGSGAIYTITDIKISNDDVVIWYYLDCAIWHTESDMYKAPCTSEEAFQEISDIIKKKADEYYLVTVRRDDDKYIVSTLNRGGETMVAESSVIIK